MLEIGIKNTKRQIVTKERTAKFMQSGALEVFATPSMIAFMESTACESVQEHLEPGYGTVGTKVDIEHIAATGLGMPVTCTSELIEIDGRRLVFKVEAKDAVEVIGRGLHERFIINNEKFEKKAADKLIEYRNDIVGSGNPANPEGDMGEEMLLYMNDGHYEVSGWMIDIAEIQENDKVLDIGCGGGMTLKRISKKVTGGHLTGLDYSATSVEMTKELNKEDYNSGKLDVIEASVDNMPFEDDTFDKIVSVESLYFWKDLEKSISEIKRVMKKGGHACICIDIYQCDELSDEAKMHIEKYDMYVPTLQEAREVFEKVGFSSVEVHTSDNGELWMCVEAVK